MKNILIAGGSGLVGTRLTAMLVAKGYTVTILTRNKKAVSNNAAIDYSYWNIDAQEIDPNAIAKADAIINLTGEGVVNKRWTTQQKKIIVDSRVNAGKLIVKGLQEITNNVEVVVNASAIGWYKPQTESSLQSKTYQEDQEPNTDFLGDTCKLWEESIEPVKQLNKRLVKLRIGIVFSKNGGAIKEFLKPLQFGIASILGNQKISWIHIDDLCNMFITAIENKNYEGVYNAVAPGITTNRELNIALAKKLKGKWFIKLPVPAFVLKIMLGEMSVEVLKSSTISCKKIADAGFKFAYPTVDEAINEMIK
ncbi:MAG: TIGR01777 family oxidoreductase [Bacteroidetes bacterium]|nr:TIGR01777 family oxidoreductase [Bacteroidota bacterium]